MKPQKRLLAVTKKFINMKSHIISKTSLVALICLSLFYSNSYIAANSLNIKNTKSTIRLLKKADIAYNSAKYAIAVNYLKTYLQTSGQNKKGAYIKMANCYWEMREFDNALKTYQLIYPTGGKEATDTDKRKIAELYAREGQYTLASEWLKGVEGYKLKANSYSQKKAIDIMKKDSDNWKVGFTSINTSYRDFSPMIHNNDLFFSSNKNQSANKKAFDWDGNNYSQLWQIPLKDIQTDQFKGKDKKLKTKNSGDKFKSLAEVFENGDNKSIAYESQRLMSKTLSGESNSIGKIVAGLDNQKLNTGAVAIDNKNHFYFSTNYAKPDKKGVNRICLMEGIYSKNKVSTIRKLNFGDSGSFSVMHPAVNTAGTILVFSSDKPNGIGGYDLYYSTRDDVQHEWNEAIQLSSTVNTIGNEVFPTITSDDNLFFSSDAMPGLGGLDIFKIPLKEAIEGTGKVEHLSYPVNSSGDDFGLTQDTDCTKGFFTSDRINCDDNIYSFSFTAVPHSNVLYIEGLVLDKQTLVPLKNATVFMYNIAEDSVYICKTDALGKYKFPVAVSSNVVIKAIEKTYFDDCLYTIIDRKNLKDNSIIKVPKDLLLSKYQIGTKWRLNNIRYDFDKYNIRADAQPILDSLVEILKKYPINVELGSHTDSRGSFTYNEILSENRARSAVAYIVEKGIDKKRIVAKGYGEYQLLNKCADGIPCSEADHQVNRRTEVKVTEVITTQKGSNYVDPDKFKDGSKISKDHLPNGFFENCK